MLAAGALLLASGCVAREDPKLRLPLEPTVVYPDAEAVTFMDADLDAGVGLDVDPNAPTYWEDVRPIFIERCQLCHTAPRRFGASFTLDTYEDATQMWGETVRAPMYQFIAERMSAMGPTHMPPSTQPQLTDGETATILAWIAGGVPEGTRPIFPDATPDSGVVGPPDTGRPWYRETDAGAPGEQFFNVYAHAPGNFTVGNNIPRGATNYLCYAFTYTGTTTRSVRSGAPFIDQERFTHHVTTYINPRENTPLDPIFTCYDFQPPLSVVTSWSPGLGADVFPTGVGFPIDPGDQIVLQVHYESVDSDTVVDATGISFHMTSSTTLTPAGEFSTGRIWRGDRVGDFVTMAGECEVQNPLTIYAVVPHMHGRGYNHRWEVRRLGSMDWTTLVDVQNWDSEHQQIYRIPPMEQTFVPGDMLRTTCVYDSQGREVRWGYGGVDEMCSTGVKHFPFDASMEACYVLDPF